MKKINELIEEECDSIKELLLQKNKEYGNSAIKPSRIFAKSDAIEQIKVRIDDKLNRIMNSQEKTIKEDTVQDLIGYLILLKIAEKTTSTEVLIEEDQETIELNQTIARWEGQILVAINHNGSSDWHKRLAAYYQSSNSLFYIIIYDPTGRSTELNKEFKIEQECRDWLVNEFNVRVIL